MLLVCMASMGQTYTNPVIPGIADAGCFRHAGRYYLGGVSTYGDFFVSSDLVNWPQRIHVFDLDNAWTHGTGAGNNQIHADDISYSGGQFHLLFSANYWGKDRHIVHITHAVAPNVDGTYREVRSDQWFENRIDPMVFCDDDGKLYLYMVKFTDGNTIWGRPMTSDFRFCGDAVQQFSSQPGTWETMDNRVAEGPFVVKYRGRYYMMYNANHTSPSFGNYRLGVCEASSPLSFGPGGKYPNPVVYPNTEILNDTYPDLLFFGTGTYCRPKHTKSFSGIDTLRFCLSSIPIENVYMKIVQRGGCPIGLNGHFVNKNTKSDFSLYPIDKKWLHKGENVLVVGPQESVGGLSSLALYSINTNAPDDILLTPGQPNIVRGPNGWEWWLVYMANEGWKRSQFIDRIHFSRGRLTVDGITGPHTTGFHPAPALPQYTGRSVDSLRLAPACLIEITSKSCESKQGVRVGNVDLLLPDTMKTNVEHDWRIEKNYGLLTAWVDNVLVADAVSVDVDSEHVSLIGDEEKNGRAIYVSYNEGFDEYGLRFNAWNGLQATTAGLSLTPGIFLKGTAAHSYEMSVQIKDNFNPSARYGVMAAYVDDRNFVKAEIDVDKEVLCVTHCEKGRINKSEYPLDTIQVIYPDVKFTDTFEKQYRFDCCTKIDAIDLPRVQAPNDTYAHDLGIDEAHLPVYCSDVAATQEAWWLDGDTWHRLDWHEAQSSNPAWQHMQFAPVNTSALRFTNSSPTDTQRHLYRIKASVKRTSANQLRVERRGHKIHLYVNERDIATVILKNNFAARCGLVNSGEETVWVTDALWYVVEK